MPLKSVRSFGKDQVNRELADETAEIPALLTWGKLVVPIQGWSCDFAHLGSDLPRGLH
jgi:hypothetical protein